MVHESPLAVVRPASTADVVTLVNLANELEFVISARGAGHGQSGQSLCEAGVLVDMRELRSIGPLQPSSTTLSVEAGTSWLEVVKTTYPSGLLPAALTMTFNPTVGGTLSAGGIGGRSWQVGAQVHGVHSLTVVTASGEAVRCSARENSELFDCCRAGLGQFGIIVEATLPLRQCGTRMHTAELEYFSTQRFLADLRTLMRGSGDYHLLGQLRPSTERPGSWSAWASIGVESDGECPPELQSLLQGLSPDKRHPLIDTPVWNDEDAPGHFFFWTAAFAGYDRSKIHPWNDTLFDFATAQALLESFVEQGDASLLSFGANAIIPVRPTGRAAPLFRMPELPAEDPGALDFGLFPRMDPALAGDIGGIMRDYARYWESRGGVRYLSSYLGWDEPADWQRHFGTEWERILAAKRKYDPRGVFGPASIRWG